jgi:hypothetical protein
MTPTTLWGVLLLAGPKQSRLFVAAKESPHRAEHNDVRVVFGKRLETCKKLNRTICYMLFAQSRAAVHRPAERCGKMRKDAEICGGDAESLSASPPRIFSASFRILFASFRISTAYQYSILKRV